MREVYANLMFAAGVGHDFEPGEIRAGAGEMALDGKIRPGRRAIGANAVFDGDFAFKVAAERGVNDAGCDGHAPMDNGPVFLLDGAALPDTAEFAGGGVGFGDEHDAAGFAIKPVDEMRAGIRPEVQTRAADEAGQGIALGGMADEAGLLRTSRSASS